MTDEELTAIGGRLAEELAKITHPQENVATTHIDMGRAAVKTLGITRVQEVPWQDTCKGCELETHDGPRRCAWNCICPSAGKGAVLVRAKDRIA